MVKDNNFFVEAQDRAAQEERRRTRDKNRENDRQRKIATRRLIVVGGIVAKYFPGVTGLQPQLRQVDTNIEFAGLEAFLSRVADDAKYVALFQELIGERASGEGLQKR